MRNLGDLIHEGHDLRLQHLGGTPNSRMRMLPKTATARMPVNMATTPAVTNPYQFGVTTLAPAPPKHNDDDRHDGQGHLGAGCPAVVVVERHDVVRVRPWKTMPQKEHASAMQNGPMISLKACVAPLAWPYLATAPYPAPRRSPPW